MLVFVVPVVVTVLVAVRYSLVTVLVAIMSMTGRLMSVLVPVSIFVVAAHRSSLLSFWILLI